MNDITLDKNVYDELMAVSRWYAAMPKDNDTPNFYAGDRFHENVFEFRMNCIPDDAINFEEFYVNYFEMENDELFVVLGSEETGEETDTRVKFVVKG